MRTIQDYIEKLDDAIIRAKNASEYDKEIVDFLEDLRRLKTPRPVHSCDDPKCIICGSSQEYDYDD
jgi:hypothetical protein